MIQEVDGRFFLIVTLVRAAYVALVLGLGAVDAQSVNHDTSAQSTIQYDSMVDGGG